jgi:hypothetical protein
MRARWSFWLILVLSVGGALLVQCRGGSTLAPASGTATPAGADGAAPSPLPAPTTSPLFSSPVSPIPAPSPTPVAQTDEYHLQSWTLFSRTHVDSIQEASGKLTKGEEGVAGAQMYAVVKFGGKDHRYPEQGYETTNEKGIASVSFSAADAGPEETVEVDVYVTYDGTTYHSVVSFAANC